MVWGLALEVVGRDFRGLKVSVQGVIQHWPILMRNDSEQHHSDDANWDGWCYQPRDDV